MIRKLINRAIDRLLGFNRLLLCRVSWLAVAVARHESRIERLERRLERIEAPK